MKLIKRYIRLTLILTAIYVSVNHQNGHDAAISFTIFTLTLALVYENIVWLYMLLKKHHQDGINIRNSVIYIIVSSAIPITLSILFLSIKALLILVSAISILLGISYIVFKFKI